MAAAGLLLLCALACGTVNADYLTQLDAYGDNSIRIRVAPPGGAITEPPLQALAGQPPALRTSVAGNGITSLDNGNLRIEVDPATGLLTATRLSDSAVLLRQTALAFSAPTVATSRLGSVAAAVTFAGTPGERVYGLGEHRTGTVQQMPYAKVFAQSQDYSLSHGSDVSIPWYTSSLGYGFVWNSPAMGTVNLSEAALAWTAEATMNVDVWVTTTSVDFDPAAGVSPHAQLLRQYVDAVGHASIMPYYATGFIQCKDRYRNQSQLLAVARGYLERQLPISVIVVDWKHWVAQGDWHFNPACWPDPQGMVDELTASGIETMVTFWPFQSTGSRYWAEFSQDGYLVNRLNATSPTSYDGGDQFLVDDTNPVVRAAIFDKFWDGYGQYGIRTVWIDAAEPEGLDSHAANTWRFSAGTGPEVGEAWVQAHTKTFAEGFATKGIMPSDYFILPRSAWAGTWRYSAALWSGDIQSTFEELALQVKVLQGVMMSGPALWTTDIGGYWGGDPADPVFQDLIVRWFQFGAFCPLFRLHGHRGEGPPANECGPTNGDNEVWNLAPEPSRYGAIVQMMHLREELREYTSQINAVAAATGLPMVRPMFLQFPLDAGCAGLDAEDQFMFGPDWLVAPVTTHLAASRTVYLPLLPATHTWVYYFNYSEVGQGGGRYTMPTPITEFPLFFSRPLPVPPQAITAPATFFFSAERNDTVVCVEASCLQANAPTQPGAYAQVGVLGLGVAAGAPDGSATIGGRTYATAALTLFYSAAWSDNYVTTAPSPPDATYTVTFANGYVLAEEGPAGSARVSYWFRRFNSSSQDYATAAAGSPEEAWCMARGYENITGNFSAAWWLPEA